MTPLVTTTTLVPTFTVSDDNTTSPVSPYSTVLTTGAWVGAIVASAVFLALVAAIIYLIVQRRRQLEGQPLNEYELQQGKSPEDARLVPLDEAQDPSQPRPTLEVCCPRSPS